MFSHYQFELPIINLSSADAVYTLLEKVVTPYLEAMKLTPNDIDGLLQDGSVSFANALEILQPCTKPSIYFVML